MDTKEDFNTINLSSGTSFDDLTITSGLGSGTFVFTSPTASPTYTISNGMTSGVSFNTDSLVFSDWSNNLTGKLTLQGDSADIDINGVSLVETLRSIQDRLNMLRPNTELERDWDELRELGERYRELEQKIQDKMKTWNAISRRR